MSEPIQAPLLRIEQKDVTPEEVAALVTVFGALAAAQDDANPPPSPSWSAPHRKIAPPVQHGPGGWRSSGLPS
ncbi:acyl-CoA carboxylase subunit epsilon [Nocardioides pacificus]